MSTLLTVEHIKKYFPIRGGLLRRVQKHLKAVDDVSFTIEKGKTLGLVGESGCGKSTLGRTIIGLYKATGGNVFLGDKNVTDLKKKEMQQYRKRMQIIFQDPNASLNPRMTIHEILREPLDIHNIGDKGGREKRIQKLMDVVELQKSALRKYPHEFSGGQKQRVGIARALSLEPDFIVADEPVSALDVSVQSAVLNLINDLQKRYNLTFLFISHDLSVIHHVSHDVGVMYLGKLVELGKAEEVYKDPKHPYTRALLSAIPTVDASNRRKRIFLEGDVPSPINPPSGCYFHPRCPEVKNICREVAPKRVNLGTKEQPHEVVCHLYG